ncbi:MAG: hypothetical protein ACKODG_01045, partial [Betaproteobacteria bacterium]
MLTSPGLGASVCGIAVADVFSLLPAVGLSVARNLIGQAPQSVAFDIKASKYSKPALLKELTKGKRVLNDTAALGKDVYEYVGPKLNDDNGIDLVNQNYSDKTRWKLLPGSESYDFKASAYSKVELLKKLAKGQLVQHDTALLGRDVYKYVGPDLSDEKGIDLVNQNYSDESHWQLMSYTPRAAITQAKILAGSVTATGDLAIEAASGGQIKARVLAAAAAVGASLGGGNATSASAAGAYAENRMYASLLAGADAEGTTRSQLSARQISVLADSEASIDAITGAAAISGSYAGAGGATSVAVGLSLAFNSIDVAVQADVNNATLSASEGNIEIRALSTGTDHYALDAAKLEKAGVTATTMDRLAQAGKAATYTSDEKLEWDYRQSDGKVEIREVVNGSFLGITDMRMPKVRVIDGSSYSVYELKNKSLLNTVLDLSTISFSKDGNWKKIDTEKMTVKSGYTVEVAEGHLAGGTVGRVYEFIGEVENYTTEDGQDIEGGTWREVKKDDIVLVAGNHKDSDKADSLAGKLYRYKGDTLRIDLSKEDFKNKDKWAELAIKEDIALEKENYSDKTRWRLADNFADPSVQRALVDVLRQAGVDLPKIDVIRNDALYRSDDGLSWVHKTSDGTVTVLKDDVVAVTTGKDAGSLYRFKGTTDVDQLAKAGDISEKPFEINLGTEKLNDEERWKKLSTSKHWLMVGDTVRVSSGHASGGVAGQIYRYIGPGNTLLTADENYADAARWVPQQAGVTVSVIEEGIAWKLVDGAGKSYTMRFDPVPAGSTTSPTAIVSRNSINAVSVGASAALGFSFGGSGKSVSGAGAVAVNTIRGSTDALLQDSHATAKKGDLLIHALSDKAIAATIVSLSVAVGAGSSSGVGASIGISVARNLIGKEGFGVFGEAATATIRAVAIDSDMTLGGSLDLRADAR